MASRRPECTKKWFRYAVSLNYTSVVETNSLIMFLSLLPFEISKFNAEVHVIALLSLFLIRFVKEVPVESCKFRLLFFFFCFDHVP